MTDVREAILSRLLTLAKTVTPGAKRMDFDVSADDQPALVLVDGEESYPAAPFEHSAEAPHKIQMEPHFVLLIQTSERAGPLLDQVRAKLIKAVIFDDQLKDLTGHQSGSRKIGARYMGCETGVQMGEGLIGYMTLRFALLYVLKPSDL